MGKKANSLQLKVDFGAVSIDDRAASATLTMKLDPERHGTTGGHVGEIYDTLRKRRLTGQLLLGDDLPSQTNMFGRDCIDGSCDTHNPSFGDETFSLRVTFDKAEISTETLTHFAKKSGWFVINDVGDIPDGNEEQAATEQAELWESAPIAQLGLDNKLCQQIFDQGVKTVGRMVRVMGGNDLEFADASKINGVTKARTKTIGSKLEQFFESINKPNPLKA
jgi:hypothetical protein